AGGFLFGAVMGTGLIVVGATIGATVLFVIARTAFGDVLRRRAGPFVRKMEDGFRANAFWYLLSLRLIPVFPFFAVNLVPALIGIPLATFVAATLIGVIPGTFVFASFGAGLGEVFDRGGEVSIGAILTPGIVAGLVGLGVLSLVPVAVKWWRGRNAA
ncbi:MAG: TVP38/TMEM64 family protein, partial [Alphaproteobacteria bacterium]|nr:TVP38/TMEM64 family protein [Alphaproteobacteria bacterium]